MLCGILMLHVRLSLQISNFIQMKDILNGTACMYFGVVTKRFTLRHNINLSIRTDVSSISIPALAIPLLDSSVVSFQATDMNLLLQRMQ